LRRVLRVALVAALLAVLGPRARAGTGTCLSIYGAALAATARTPLPVFTTATAVLRWPEVDPATFHAWFGVAAPEVAALSPDPGLRGPRVAFSPPGSGTTWTFAAQGPQVTLTETLMDIQGDTFLRLQALGPVWRGGSARLVLAFPRGRLGSDPTLGQYAASLVAALGHRQASLTVVTGGVVLPPPTVYAFPWGTFDLAAFLVHYPSSPLAACSAWHPVYVYAYWATTGALVPVQAMLLDIGGGAALGAAAGDFVTVSDQDGVELVTMFRIHGLRAAMGR